MSFYSSVIFDNTEKVQEIWCSMSVVFLNMSKFSTQYILKKLGEFSERFPILKYSGEHLL